ncbi:MAG: pyruvate, water dikinase regulatory protein [Pseudomonadota bacterium]
MSRTIFFVSDGTGITSETIGKSLLTQFEGIDFRLVRVPFIDNSEKAIAARERVNRAAERDRERPIVINTLVNPHLSEIMSDCNGLVLDVFHTFVKQIEAELGVRRSPRVGISHGMSNLQSYEQRMGATNYALKHDDGADVNYQEADVILVGVSRSGKTPTCLYLALHYGIKAGNYPLTPDDLDALKLPKMLTPYKRKLFGLTIEPERLRQIREIRRPNSRYADARQVQREVEEAESLFRIHGLPSLNTTYASVEEIASKVLVSLGLERSML